MFETDENKKEVKKHELILQGIIIVCLLLGVSFHRGGIMIAAYIFWALSAVTVSFWMRWVKKEDKMNSEQEQSLVQDQEQQDEQGE